MYDDLDPSEFEDTAKSVVETCANTDAVAARAALLAEAGLLSVAAPDAIGGLGLPLDFAVPICAASGAGLLGFPIVEALLLSKALADVDADLAGKIASGEKVATVAWRGVAEDEVVGCAPMALDADVVLIFRADGSAVLAPTGNAVKPEPTGAFDVDAPDALIRVSGPLEGPVLDPAVVTDIFADAKILRSAYIKGAAAECLSIAAAYAQERVQFGRPLSANQVLRHRMSRDALSVETLKNGLIRALDTEGAEAEMARDALWLDAARTGPAVAESAIQVFGGMGFTWDVPLHRYLRQMRAQASYGAALDKFDSFAANLVNTTDNSWYGDLPNGL